MKLNERIPIYTMKLNKINSSVSFLLKILKARIYRKTDRMKDKII